MEIKRIATRPSRGDLRQRLLGKNCRAATPLPYHVVVLDTGSELDEHWVVLCEAVRPVSKAHLGRLVAGISSQLQSKINSSLQIALGLD
jgi:mRNA-degrading endonuclease toxin of MazEF toxin-antitoxin module